ncbi:hypothetical protein [Jiangella endophytica]|uniref:hypothetical protein n=1 Tax=Jiangella endophytica TaxID=1623398 RepID=UPI000E3519D8|nr:hypothetical protein [Jiangella endophytica]
MVTRYANEEHPPQGIPPNNMGRIQVFVRFVDDAGAERYLPATAMRWTTIHVMVSYVGEGYPGRPNAASLAWLRAEDVWRVMQRRR